MIPDQHRRFVHEILERHSAPELPGCNDLSTGLMGWKAATAYPQVEDILRHPNVVMVGNALGTPPPDLVAQIQHSGRAVGARR